jgi:hypothetical protein
MFHRRMIHALAIPPLLILVICAGCNRTANAPPNPSGPKGSPTTTESAQSHAIETETVALQPTL